MIRRLIVLLPLAVAALSPLASAAPLAKDTAVRVRSGYLPQGWHEGRIFTAANKCTMVMLKNKLPSGHTSISLVVVRDLQRQDGNGWSDVPVRPLIAGEPKACREGGDND